MRKLPHFPQILLACLLMVILLAGCSATPTPRIPTQNIPSQNPLETPTPCVNMSVSAKTLKVGETLTVTGTAPGAVNPNYFGLETKDQDADASSMLINLLAKPLRAADVSNVLEMVSADYTNGKAVIELKAVGAGTTELNYFLSAENFCGVSLGSGVSSKVTITVTP